MRIAPGHVYLQPVYIKLIRPLVIRARRTVSVPIGVINLQAPGPLDDRNIETCSPARFGPLTKLGMGLGARRSSGAQPGRIEVNAPLLGRVREINRQTRATTAWVASQRHLNAQP